MPPRHPNNPIPNDSKSFFFAITKQTNDTKIDIINNKITIF